MIVLFKPYEADINQIATEERVNFLFFFFFRFIQLYGEVFDPWKNVFKTIFT